MVHTFEIHGLKLALDVESGALHVLDGPAFLMVSLLADNVENESAFSRVCDEFGVETAREVFAEIDELRKKGLLFSGKRDIGGEDGKAVKALCLHLAHECNLRCGYCFAGNGSYGSNGLMTLQTSKKAIDFLLQECGSIRHCEVDFFGGEPLLNFEVLKETVAYGRKAAAMKGKVINFTLTTNGLSLNQEVRAYLANEKISVVLSLDGRPEVHDAMRTLPGGSGSYSIVLENCRELVQGNGMENYYARGTYTRFNLDFSKDFSSLMDKGFTRISLEPAVLTPSRKESLREEDLPMLFAEYEQLAHLVWELEEAGKEVSFFHFELDLLSGPCVKKRASGCGAGLTYLAVTPEGEIYPCHQFVGEKEFSAGTVEEGYNRNNYEEFSRLGIDDKDKCKACFARYYCGGGCHANAWKINGSMHVPYELGCKLHLKRLECGLYLQAKRLLQKK